MRIAFVAPEMAPFLKTGGLGDVAGALPDELAKCGHDVSVFLPYYSQLELGRLAVHERKEKFTVTIDRHEYEVTLSQVRDKRRNVQILLIGNKELFDRSSLYVDPSTGVDYEDNDIRFLFFSKAVIGAIQRIGPAPEIIHVHDWQSALIPVLLKNDSSSGSYFENTKTVLTVHNLAYQGAFPSERFRLLELPTEMMAPETGPFEFWGKMNYLKAGLVFADRLTTVSPKYAMEIQENSETGCGLDGVLRSRSNDLFGILNGVDYKVWSPSRDKQIPATYHLNNLSGKRTNKVELLNRSSLPIRDTAPLIGMITRLVDQKGIDLVAEASEELFKMNVQMILLGSGEKKYHEFFKDLEDRYPDKCRCYLTFDNVLAHHIEAASDIYLMPSRYEPCGLNQMYSLKYGTVPVVRNIGGLSNSVVKYDATTGEGTGFLFDEYSSTAMIAELRKAVSLFAKKRAWTKLMKNGMREDFSWHRSALSYCRLFESLVNH